MTETTKPAPQARRELILQLLAGGVDADVNELSARFRVTTMTVRRDLDILAAEGRINRTHGGAMLAAPAVAAFAFQDRRQTHMAEKQAIARAAARLVEPGMTVILDTGTTTLELARLLGGIPRLKVLTSSLSIASTLMAHEQLELVLLGGTVNRNSPDLSGALTVENLTAFHAQLVFVGADAVDERGLHTGNLAIAHVSRAMMAAAERVILVADSSKFNRRAFVRICGWKAIGQVIVDDDLPPEARQWLGGQVRDCTFAPICER